MSDRFPAFRGHGATVGNQGDGDFSRGLSAVCRTYFRANIAGAISPEPIKFIQNLKMVNNMENLISENLYIFEETELKSIKEAIQEVLDIYPRVIFCIPQRLYVTQS